MKEKEKKRVRERVRKKEIEQGGGIILLGTCVSISIKTNKNTFILFFLLFF